MNKLAIVLLVLNLVFAGLSEASTALYVCGDCNGGPGRGFNYPLYYKGKYLTSSSLRTTPGLCERERDLDSRCHQSERRAVDSNTNVSNTGFPPNAVPLNGNCACIEDRRGGGSSDIWYLYISGSGLRGPYLGLSRCMNAGSDIAICR